MTTTDTPRRTRDAHRVRSTRVTGPTPASTWYAVSGAPITDELLEWPPDLFALMGKFP